MNVLQKVPTVGDFRSWGQNHLYMKVAGVVSRVLNVAGFGDDKILDSETAKRLIEIVRQDAKVNSGIESSDGRLGDAHQKVVDYLTVC